MQRPAATAQGAAVDGHVRHLRKARTDDKLVPNLVDWNRPEGRLAGHELESPPAPALLIAEIRDVDGHLLYRAEPRATRVSPPGITM